MLSSSAPLATVLLDPPTALLVGAALGVVSTRLILHSPEAEARKTILLATAWSVLYGLCVGYFFIKQPDWMLVYLKDSREVSLLPAFLIFLAICAAHGAAGAAATSYLIARGQRRWAWLILAGAVLTVAGVFWLQWRQYFLVGTYAEFHAGAAPRLETLDSMKLSMNVTTVLAGVPGLLIVFARLRGARAVPRA